LIAGVSLQFDSMKAEREHPTILVVDDDADARTTLEDILADRGFTPVLATDARIGLDLVRRHPPAAVLLDLDMPGMSGLEALPEIKAIDPEIPVIILTGEVRVPIVVEAMRRGAYDYLTKPWRPEELLLRLHRALERRTLAEEVRSLRQRLHEAAPLRELMGSSPAVADVVRQVEQVAGSTLTVLLQGETGTGKELVARAIHAGSAYREGPFVAVDCGAMPETLIESELFGHEKGAFTDAHTRKPGRFQQAAGGSLFLDEISNLSPATQAKLLRVLQDRQVQPLGATVAQPVDVRVIAAANVSLETEIRAGRFRQDLYYRVAEFIIALPALRSRPSDIRHLANRFLAETRMELKRPVRGFSEEAMARLEVHHWPGNVRELRNVVRRAVLLSTDLIGPEALGAISVSEPSSADGRDGPAGPRPTLKEVGEQAAMLAERHAIRDALDASGGNKTEAARLLRTDYKTLHVKMKRYGVSLHDSPRRERGEPPYPYKT
jgi:two-component system, NtrC family, response regulator HydG